jgi:nucleotide-binding universal stress UspA family protein
MSALAAVDLRRINAQSLPSSTPVARPSAAAPVVAAIDGSSSSRAAIDVAVRLAAEVNAPLAFVYVRRGPAGVLGTPFFQRRLTAEMRRGRRVLDRALRLAARGGVEAEGEILEGSPRRRIPEFATARGARLIVVGSRRRKFSRSVSCGIVRAANGPVVIARPGKPRVGGVELSLASEQ